MSVARLHVDVCVDRDTVHAIVRAYASTTPPSYVLAAVAAALESALEGAPLTAEGYLLAGAVSRVRKALAKQARAERLMLFLQRPR